MYQHHQTKLHNSRIKNRLSLLISVILISIVLSLLVFISFSSSTSNTSTVTHYNYNNIKDNNIESIRDNQPTLKQNTINNNNNYKLESKRMTSRVVSRIVTGIPTSDGAGVKLKRVIGGQIDHLDPFLLLDEFKSDKKDDYIAGFPSHPHRGFETVTYLIHGSMEHKDHKGNHGILKPGSIQWMTAGKGIIHSEMPKQENGLLWGFQLWINLNSANKMMEPRYQDIPPEQVPIVNTSNGIKVKVLAGKYRDTVGPVSGVITNPTYLDVELEPGVAFEEDIPVDQTSFAYVYSGDGKFGPSDNQKQLKESQMGILETSPSSTKIQVVGGDSGVRFLLIAATPIKEPIARHGPFVMNTQQEIQKAFYDYQTGNF